MEKSLSEIEERRQKLKEIQKMGLDPYGRRFERTHHTKALQEKFRKLKAGEKRTKFECSLAGRIRSIRKHGKLIFSHIEDFSGRIQICLELKTLGKSKFDFFDTKLNVGDIIGVKGFVFKTMKGEVTIWVKEFELLSKSLRPLPKEWYGLKDIELRYRQRYVDLIINPEVKEIFERRSKIIQAMRDFLTKEGFIEVETPILQPIYGGAAARPFSSKLNALDMKVYMRISNELYLKRLIVGGYEKIFEFSKDFRNEGIDRLHNPEFLQMETMWAYADYKDNMKLCEEMISYVAKSVLGTFEIVYQGKKINLKPPWKKIKFVDVIKTHTKIDFNKVRSFEEAKEKVKTLDVDVSDCESIGEIMIKVFEDLVQPKLIQPTIVYDYPVEAAGLAKVKKDDKRFVEAFEPIINGWEIGLSYCEENDPERLKKYWKKAEEYFRKGDEEAQRMDEDFIRALEYGMPPTSGLGIGVDRLTMLLTNSSSIRDVIFFPFMRPEERGEGIKNI
jgi:lysyl-tRNA synthetase class 2